MSQHQPIEPSGRTRVLEVRRGLRHWEVKSLEANEAAWLTTRIPLSIPEHQAVDVITHLFMGKNPMVETITVMVRKHPSFGAGTGQKSR